MLLSSRGILGSSSPPKKWRKADGAAGGTLFFIDFCREERQRRLFNFHQCSQNLGLLLPPTPPVDGMGHKTK